MQQHQIGPVDIKSIAVTTVSNVTLLYVNHMYIIYHVFQWIGYASILLGFTYNLVKFVEWIKQTNFFKRKKKKDHEADH